MERQWFYTKNDNQIGPISEKRLRELFNIKELINTETFVWSEHMNKWLRAIDVPEFQPVQQKCHQGNWARPGVRFWARFLDYLFFSLLGGLIVSMINPFMAVMFDIFHPFLKFFIVFLFWIPIEAIFLTFLGATPGKWLLNIKVSDTYGNNLRFGTAIERSAGVLLCGLGFGIPYIVLLTLGYSYWALLKNRTTFWDKDEILVAHEKIGIFPLFIIIILIMCCSFFIQYVKVLLGVKTF
jgi:uncharacterized RDD family membrane protein YckC